MKDLHIKKMEETIHNLETKVKEKDQKNKNLQEKVCFLSVELTSPLYYVKSNMKSILLT